MAGGYGQRAGDCRSTRPGVHRSVGIDRRASGDLSGRRHQRQHRGGYERYGQLEWNGAQIDQQGGSQNNSAFVRQFSNDNNARVRQEGSQSSGNTATITQRMGDNNTAYVDQGGSTENFGGGISNQATILQSGQNGTARVQQFYLANNGIVTITQGDGGSDNEATVA